MLAGMKTGSRWCSSVGFELVVAIALMTGVLPARPALVAHWSFDEQSQNTAGDSSGNGNKGTFVGGVSRTDGILNNAVQVNGADAYIDYGENAILNFASGAPFTFSGWFKTTASQGPIFAQRNREGYGLPIIGLYVGFDGVWSSAGQLMAIIRSDDVNENIRVQGGRVDDGKWHHFALVRTSDGLLRLFLDGALQGTASGASSNHSITTNLRSFGYDERWGQDDYWAPQFFSGMLDDMRIYDQALSQDEVKGLLFEAPLRYSANGHIYQLVRTTLTWQEARQAAAVRIFASLSGHLATIASPQENEFIRTTFSREVSGEFAWIGGREPADDGVWRWDAGPESGLQFSLWASPTGPFHYANWGGIEPNDNKPDEDYLMFNLGTTFYGIANGQWADAAPVPNWTDPVVGYLVEYEPSNFSNDPVAWWRGDGNANDSAGSNHGTLFGNTSFVEGHFGKAFNFDGDDDYVTFGTSAGNFGTGDFTIAYWMKKNGARGESFLEKRPACNMDFGSSWWCIRGGDTTVGLEVSGASLENYNHGFETTQPLNDGQWHHVAWTRQGTQLSVYIDGALDNTGTTSGIADLNNTAELTAGKSVCVGIDGTSALTGQLDDIRLYSRALSQEEIQGLASATSFSPAPPALETGSVIFKTASGGMAVLLPNGKTVAINGGRSVTPDWQLVGIADFNGDGKSDFLWQHSDGRLAIWLMDGTAVLKAFIVGEAPRGWKAISVTDLNGDKHHDVVWRHRDGSIAVAYFIGTTPGATAVLSGPSASATWSIVGVADFNRDGRVEFLWESAAHLLTIAPAVGPYAKGAISLNTQPFHRSWHVLSVTDYNGDGWTDILWQNDDGSVAVWLMNSTRRVGVKSLGKVGSPGSKIVGAK